MVKVTRIRLFSVALLATRKLECALAATSTATKTMILSRSVLREISDVIVELMLLEIV
jgi:hypothetical protein